MPEPEQYASLTLTVMRRQVLAEVDRVAKLKVPPEMQMWISSTSDRLRALVGDLERAIGEAVAAEDDKATGR